MWWSSYGLFYNNLRLFYQGWIKALRKMKENIFVDINDGSSKNNLQIVVRKDLKTDEVNFGASIEATGVLGTTPKGQLELCAESIKVIGPCPITEEYPFIPRQSYPPEYIRQHLHLRSRVSSFNSMMRIRNSATKYLNDFLFDERYLQVHTPILTSNDCEGAGEVFRVQPESESLLKHMTRDGIPLESGYFDKKVFLTVSGQLHLEAMAHGLGNVYTFGPTFRAENSKSQLHLSEFYMLELEQCFVGTIEDVTGTVERMMKRVTNEILAKHLGDLESCSGTKGDGRAIRFDWLDKKFPMISYENAITILRDNQTELKNKVNEADGLIKEHELFLVRYFGMPIFVVDWPSALKPFYMREKSNGLVEAFDFLVPHVGELAGGSVREDNYARLKSKLPKDNLGWYLELRKFGGCTTGGFGMGFERYLQFLTGIVNIKDVIPYPRWAHHCDA